MAERPGHAQDGEAYDSNENMKTPGKGGGPPRPATEPTGSEQAAPAAATLTDPATGEPRTDVRHER